MDAIDINPWAALAMVAAGLVLSALLSAGEAAVAAASRARVLALEGVEEGRPGLLGKLLERRERVAGALLIASILVKAAVSAFVAGLFIGLCGVFGLLYAAAALSVAIVLAEAMARTFAAAAPERVALALARPAAWSVRLLGPVHAGIEAAARGLLRVAGLAGNGAQALSGSEEIRGTVDLMHREGAFEKLDRDMVGGILDLKDLTVSDVMVHRTKMVTIDAGEAPEKVVRDMMAAPYTRIPLWRGSPENIVGVLHGKDLLRALAAAGGDATKIDLTTLALPVWFVPDSTSLQDQLKAFLRRKTHFALVVDEYGEVMGLVTLEDILEEIVGDIKDEHDVQVTGVRPQPDGSVNVDGAVPIRDLNRAMDWRLPDEEATTIAGLVIHEARLIPEAGQSFTFHGFRFHVLRRQRNRITALKIAPLERRP